MTIITLATGGFREGHSLSFEGRVFTILLIIFGAGTIAYTIGTLIQFMVEGQLRTLLGRKKVEITIAAQVLRDADIRKNLGIIIVSINKRNGQPIFNPGPETRMAAGEILISLGKPPAIKNSEEIASGQVCHAE